MNGLEPALYIVATPIGNLSDLTRRAEDVLRNADVVAAEDTRHSKLLLDHYGIKPPQMVAFHDHNELERRDAIAEKVSAGLAVALISDAGTPLICDPGFHVVDLCRESGIRVIPVPGCCAAITALSASGLPTDRFVFRGFLPGKDKALREALESLRSETATTVFYESPRRVLDTVRLMAEILGSRRLVIARELTKTFESFYDHPADEMASFLAGDPDRQKGEFVIMVAGAEPPAEGAVTAEAERILKVLLPLMPMRKAAKAAAEITGLRGNDLYEAALRLSGKDS